MKLPNFSHFTEENMEHTKTFTILSWVLRGIAAVILLQTLFFKFSGAKESVYIFTAVGMEPWGRIGSGVADCVDSLAGSQDGSLRRRYIACGDQRGHLLPPDETW